MMVYCRFTPWDETAMCLRHPHKTWGNYIRGILPHYGFDMSRPFDVEWGVCQVIYSQGVL